MQGNQPAFGSKFQKMFYAGIMQWSRMSQQRGTRPLEVKLHFPKPQRVVRNSEGPRKDVGGWCKMTLDV